MIKKVKIFSIFILTAILGLIVLISSNKLTIKREIVLNNDAPFASIKLTTSIPVNYRIEEIESVISWVKLYHIIKGKGIYPDDFLAYIHIGTKNDEFKLLDYDKQNLIVTTVAEEFKAKIGNDTNKVLYSKIYKNDKINKYFMEYEYEDYHIMEYFASNDKTSDDDYAYVVIYFNKIDEIDRDELINLMKTMKLNIY